LIIPVLIIIFGIILLILDESSYTGLGLIGSLMTIIGILTLGVLLGIIFAISFSTRALSRTTNSQPSFREKLEEAEHSIQTKLEKDE
jgi:hypothetical protein